MTYANKFAKICEKGLLRRVLGVLAEPFMGGIVGGAVTEGGCEMTGGTKVYGREGNIV